ncbi:hypothetical protein WOLCODRAFT_144811 [Wolfiporia cocos MD-104 SS10]|uniref:Uncharacterized protein n=1 Tax=Wolfiporia cocos (strain MD-104) TaxID=742152 RepID=A0A2H3JPG4_WOLCO|nr:hypothetical protein WOLCODRAFT_144811 [Wolfiporia cocos MD-104 SS10]
MALRLASWKQFEALLFCRPIAQTGDAAGTSGEISLSEFQYADSSKLGGSEYGCFILKECHSSLLGCAYPVSTAKGRWARLAGEPKIDVESEVLIYQADRQWWKRCQCRVSRRRRRRGAVWLIMDERLGQTARWGVASLVFGVIQQARAKEADASSRLQMQVVAGRTAHGSARRKTARAQVNGSTGINDDQQKRWCSNSRCRTSVHQVGVARYSQEKSRSEFRSVVLAGPPPVARILQVRDEIGGRIVRNVSLSSIPSGTRMSSRNLLPSGDKDRSGDPPAEGLAVLAAHLAPMAFRATCSDGLAPRRTGSSLRDISLAQTRSCHTSATAGGVPTDGQLSRFSALALSRPFCQARRPSLGRARARAGSMRPLQPSRMQILQPVRLAVEGSRRVADMQIRTNAARARSRLRPGRVLVTQRTRERDSSVCGRCTAGQVRGAALETAVGRHSAETARRDAEKDGRRGVAMLSIRARSAGDLRWPCPPVWRWRSGVECTADAGLEQLTCTAAGCLRAAWEPVSRRGAPGLYSAFVHCLDADADGEGAAASGAGHCSSSSHLLAARVGCVLRRLAGMLGALIAAIPASGSTWLLGSSPRCTQTEARSRRSDRFSRASGRFARGSQACSLFAWMPRMLWARHFVETRARERGLASRERCALPFADDWWTNNTAREMSWEWRLPPGDPASRFGVSATPYLQHCDDTPQATLAPEKTHQGGCAHSSVEGWSRMAIAVRVGTGAEKQTRRCWPGDCQGDSETELCCAAESEWWPDCRRGGDHDGYGCDERRDTGLGWHGPVRAQRQSPSRLASDRIAMQISLLSATASRPREAGQLCISGGPSCTAESQANATYLRLQKYQASRDPPEHYLTVLGGQGETANGKSVHELSRSLGAIRQPCLRSGALHQGIDPWTNPWARRGRCVAAQGAARMRVRAEAGAARLAAAAGEQGGRGESAPWSAAGTGASPRSPTLHFPLFFVPSALLLLIRGTLDGWSIALSRSAGAAFLASSDIPPRTNRLITKVDAPVKLVERLEVADPAWPAVASEYPLSSSPEFVAGAFAPW